MDLAVSQSSQLIHTSHLTLHCRSSHPLCRLCHLQNIDEVTNHRLIWCTQVSILHCYSCSTNDSLNIILLLGGKYLNSASYSIEIILTSRVPSTHRRINAPNGHGSNRHTLRHPISSSTESNYKIVDMFSEDGRYLVLRCKKGNSNKIVVFDLYSKCEESPYMTERSCFSRTLIL